MSIYNTTFNSIIICLNLFKMLYHVYMNDKDLFRTIAHNIKIERAVKSITQSQLAELVGVHEKYIGKIQDFTKIKQDNFWQMWYELELKKNEKLKDDNKYKQSIIYDICETLIKLEMPKSMVIKFTKHIDITVFGEGSDLQQETFKEIVNRISHAKYISKII